MSWSSRMPYGPKTSRAIATIHNWQFVNKRSISRATPEHSPAAVEGFSLWFCSNCSKYLPRGRDTWVSKCPPCERPEASS